METQLCKIIEQVNWLKKVTSSMRSFFDLFDFKQFGSCGPWLQSAFETLDYCIYNNHSSIYGELYFLNSFKHVVSASNLQANNLPMNRTKEKQQREQPT